MIFKEISVFYVNCANLHNVYVPFFSIALKIYMLKISVFYCKISTMPKRVYLAYFVFTLVLSLHLQTYSKL